MIIARDKLALLIFISYLLIPFSTIAMEPPTQIDYVQIREGDLPAGFSTGALVITNDQAGAGWLTFTHKGEDTPIQGVRQGFSNGDTTWGFKIGYFSTAQEAKEGAQTAILTENTLYINQSLPGNPSGPVYGDHCFYWDLDLEPAGLRQSISPSFFQSMISFSKGKYAVLVDGFSKNSPIDQHIINLVASKFEAKISVAIEMDNFALNLESLIPHAGTRQSFQVVLDSFSSSYKKGKYKTAADQMGAFINHLVAQRGKHVSEQSYLVLRSYADSVIQALSKLT